MFHFDFGNDNDAVLSQHLLKLFINGAFQKDHINIGPLTIANKFINLLNPIIDHILKAGLPLPTSNQIGRLDITINKNASLTLILITDLFVTEQFFNQDAGLYLQAEVLAVEGFWTHVQTDVHVAAYHAVQGDFQHDLLYAAQDLG